MLKHAKQGGVTRAKNNRTLTIPQREHDHFNNQIFSCKEPLLYHESILNRIINDDITTIIDYLPQGFVDLLILDPPYNLTKSFNGRTFTKTKHDDYSQWFESWFVKVLPLLHEKGSIYVCSDWHTSTAIYDILAKYTVVRNRITFERDKGRGAMRNWKNCHEDIWFCTIGDSYTFNVDDVKLKRKVLASYKSENGTPKDWVDDKESGKSRLTFPSNLWTDITIPFWSMPENTPHPTQKPEKLMAKLILASSNSDDVVFDPFMGSGTSVVTAKKLGRNFVGVDIDTEYCMYALKRLAQAEFDKDIQGYKDGVFWERNSGA